MSRITNKSNKTDNNYSIVFKSLNFCSKLPVSVNFHNDWSMLVNIFDSEICSIFYSKYVHSIHPNTRQHITTRIVFGVTGRTSSTCAHTLNVSDKRNPQIGEIQLHLKVITGKVKNKFLFDTHHIDCFRKQKCTAISTNGLCCRLQILDLDSKHHHHTMLGKHHHYPYICRLMQRQHLTEPIPIQSKV